MRWWNVRHPAAYAARLAAGQSPAQAREILTTEQRRVEDLLLRVRLRDGLPLERLTPSGQAVAAYGLVFAGVGALRSWQGAFFHYPVAIRFLR